MEKDKPAREEPLAAIMQSHFLISEEQKQQALLKKFNDDKLVQELKYDLKVRKQQLTAERNKWPFSYRDDNAIRNIFLKQEIQICKPVEKKIQEIFNQYEKEIGIIDHHELY
jgi:hypothetical protein